MGVHYTIHHDEGIDARVDLDITLLRERLLARFPQLEAIVLVGGFGRGEGAVLIEENGNIRPVNDYDLVLITSSKTKVGDIRSFRQALATEIGIPWVDLRIIEKARLGQLRHTMFNYDLKYGGYVLWGRDDVLDQIPEMDPHSMPLIEAEILFFTRLWCFLGLFSARMLDEPPDKKEWFVLANQLSKATLACSDALLISRGEYHVSYAERCRRFLRLFGDRAELAQLVAEATEFKLRPTREIGYDVVERWFVVRRHFLDTMSEFVSLMYRREFRDWEHYGWWYEHNPRTLLRRVYHSVLRRNCGYRDKLQVDLAQLYLVAAFERKGIVERYLDLARQRLAAANGAISLSINWDEARALAADLRMQV